jgi:hypothetical protein
MEETMIYKKVFFNSLIFVLLLFSLINKFLFAHDLKTPRGTTITHLHLTDEGWIENGENYTAEEWTTYSDGYYANFILQRIDRANRAYNCHAFAWAGSVQSDPSTYCVIDLASQADGYINDGSYVEVQKQYGTHVSYRGKEHSLKVYNGDIMISKWGRLPLYTHYLLNDPYNATSSDVKYYRRSANIPIDCPDINSAVIAAAGQTIHAAQANYILSSNASIIRDVNLIFASGSTLDLKGYKIEALDNNSQITRLGNFHVNGAIVKDGSVIKAFYPTIEAAIANSGAFGIGIQFERIELPDSTLFTLSEDITVPYCITLVIKSGSTVDLHGHKIICGREGTIVVENGAKINCTFLKNSDGSIEALYPTIQSACDDAVSDQTIELQRRTYNESPSLSGKSDVKISGYGATINGTINLTNATYCRLYGVYLPSGHVYINGGIGNIIMDVRSDREYEVLYIENTANNAVYGLTATNGDMNNFGLYIYNSTGDICRSSRIENHACGIYLSGTSSYNVTEDYFCNNGFDVDAEGGAYAYLLHNTYSRIKPISVYGNCTIPDPPSALACSSPSGLAKSNTASLSLNNQAEVKGTPAGELDRMYSDLIHRTSQDTTLDHKGRIEKYKSEYLSIAEKSKGELKKSFNDLSKLKNSLSLTANCLRYLGEEGSLSSYLSELLGMSDLQPYSPYIKKYLIPGLIGKKDYTGALAQCEEILKAKDIDRDLTCEMLYEKGIINRFYLNNNTEAYRAFSSITAKYPNHPLGKMAMGQISEMPGVEVEKPGLKSLGNTSEGFTCSNYPNPFNPSTRFNFSIPSDGFTELKIYNSLGQEVKTLVSDYLAKGKYTFEWNAASYSSGIYYYFLKSGNNVTTSKIILLK